jgi:beta-glucoside operon transcriptional antiterminator
MNLINAKKTPSDRPDPQADFSQMLEEVTEIVEDHFHVMVDRESFNFTRYATHIQYLFQRLRQKTAIDSDNLRMYKDLREEFPAIAACVEEIAEHIEKTWYCTLSEEEKLYLILHVNRILAKEGL